MNCKTKPGLDRIIALCCNGGTRGNSPSDVTALESSCVLFFEAGTIETMRGQRVGRPGDAREELRNLVNHLISLKGILKPIIDRR